MKYHLDTCIVIAYLNGNQKIADKLKSCLPDVVISSIVLGELLYGARASSRSEQNLEILGQFTTIIGICNFDEKSSGSYSKIRLSLRQKGRPIGEIDALIASIAIANNAVLVTDNIKHFKNIDDLTIENWLRDD